jgi:hypothetical protein
MRFETRPLPAVWPGGVRTPPGERRIGPFRATWNATMELLEQELRLLDAKEPVVIEAGYEPFEIRQDGRPRANARPRDPAVIISFTGRAGALRIGCDVYVMDRANLRAIALTLESLRAVDRYGATRRGEQYQGWQALPVQAGLTVQEAESFIRTYGGHERPMREAYHAAARHLYPKNGDDHALWDHLQRAKDALGL